MLDGTDILTSRGIVLVTLHVWKWKNLELLVLMDCTKISVQICMCNHLKYINPPLFQLKYNGEQYKSVCWLIRNPLFFSRQFRFFTTLIDFAACS